MAEDEPARRGLHTSHSQVKPYSLYLIVTFAARTGE
jgi:hypothetical protein